MATTQHSGNGQRKVMATARQGGSLRKGNRYTMGTGVSAATQALWAEPSPYETSGNPFAPMVPSLATRNKIADRAMAGLGSTAPAKGGHWGKVCPACGLQRSRTNLCGCNS